MDQSITLDILFLYLLIFIGFILGKLLKSRRDKYRTILTKILINIISPLQIFITLATSSTQFGLKFIIQINLVMLLVFTINSTSILIFIRNKDWVNKQQKGTYFLNVGFPNVMFFTIPLILTLFSDQLIVVSVFYSVGALILRGSVGIVVCQRYGQEQKEKKSRLNYLLDILKSLFTFPPFISIVLSAILIAFGWNVTIGDKILPIKPIINEIASDTSLILVGMVLASLKIQEAIDYKKHILIVAFWRIIISFFIYISIVWFLNFGDYDTEVKQILLIIVMGPPAVFNVIFSVYFKLDEKFAAMAVATITLLVLCILPLILILGRWMFG